jgi:hypothetical protein
MLRPLEYQIPSQVGETNQAVLAEPELCSLQAEISKIGQNNFSTGRMLPQNINGYRQFRDRTEEFGAGCYVLLGKS